MHQYMLGSDDLESSSIGEDLGVLLGRKLTMTQQCNTVAKANSLLACFRRIVAGRLREGTLPLYSALEKTHQKCWVQF